MHTFLRPGTLVLTLGSALLIGCNASSDSPTKTPPSQSQAKGDPEKAAKSEKSAAISEAVKSERPAATSEAVKSERPAATSEAATPREYVLTVEGMT